MSAFSFLPGPPCDCEAYPFSHRLGNSFCLAPQAPLYRPALIESLFDIDAHFAWW